MDGFFGLVKGLLFTVCALVALWVVSVAITTSMPAEVSMETIELNPKASTGAKLVLRGVFATGLAKTRVDNYGVFKLATLKMGDETVKFVAVPGTKWIRYE